VPITERKSEKTMLKERWDRIRDFGEDGLQEAQQGNFPPHRYSQAPKQQDLWAGPLLLLLPA
jgi:hypothetical protein